VPLSRAFLSLGISLELPLFCSARRFPALRHKWLLGQHRHGRGVRGPGLGMSQSHGEGSGRFPTSTGLQRSACCPSGAPEGRKYSLVGCAFIN